MCIRDRSYYYSLANKTFDYVQAGVPALHMNFPEYKKINQEFEVGVLVDNLISQGLAKIVNELLEEEERYLKFQENCREAAKVWKWEREEEKLVEFYKRIFAS